MTLKAPGPRASCSSLSWSARYYIAGACKQCGAQRRWRRQYSACSCHCRRRRAVRHCRRHSAVRRRRRRCCSPRSFFLSSLEWLCKCSSRDARWPLPSPHSTVSKLFGYKDSIEMLIIWTWMFFSIKWSGESPFWYVFSDLFVNCFLCRNL